MRTRRGIAVLAAAVALAVITTSCSTDPTTSAEFTDLEDRLGTVTEERDELRAELEVAHDELVEAAEEVRSAAAATREAEAEEADALRRRNELERSLSIAETSLDRSFDLAAVEVVQWLSCADPSFVDGLGPEVLEVRDDLAAATGWFETVDEYDLCESQRAFVNADNAVTRQQDPALTEVWDRYWEAEYGSTEEAAAIYEFALRRLLATIRQVEEARSILDDAVPDRVSDAEDA